MKKWIHRNIKNEKYVYLSAGERVPIEVKFYTVTNIGSSVPVLKQDDYRK